MSEYQWEEMKVIEIGEPLKFNGNELESCPFCGGKARISSRDMKFMGQNYIGWKKIKFAAYGMCNKCHAKGPTITEVIITDTPESRNQFSKLKLRAAEAWNRRWKND